MKATHTKRILEALRTARARIDDAARDERAHTTNGQLERIAYEVERIENDIAGFTERWQKDAARDIRRGKLA